MPGTLFVVATPIGNLEDITLRALRTLREVDLVAAEDTRRTAKLLAHYEIRKPVVSLREHNEHREAPRLVQRLAAGTSIALVSDAGTPGIADPGARLVAAARGASIPVVPIPGPSAITAALSVSGFHADAFVFMGFPPAAGTARDEWFASVAMEPRLVVFFEAPHRIARTLAQASADWVKRHIYVYRELTKINEELVITTKQTADAAPTAKGEFVCLVSPREVTPNQVPEPSKVLDLFGHITDYGGLDSVVVAEAVALLLGLKSSKVASMLKKARILVKRSSESAS